MFWIDDIRYRTVARKVVHNGQSVTQYRYDSRMRDVFGDIVADRSIWVVWPSLLSDVGRVDDPLRGSLKRWFFRQPQTPAETDATQQMPCESEPLTSKPLLQCRQGFLWSF